ncbi:hypothetical protein HK405_015295, partial [Cladochytrium tenue]
MTPTLLARQRTTTLLTLRAAATTAGKPTFRAAFPAAATAAAARPRPVYPAATVATTAATRRTMASFSTAGQAPHKLLMIPGPIEFDSEVLAAMATPATSHVDPGFIETFGATIELLRKVFYAPTGQPFVVAGSGTLAWDMTAANLVEPGDAVLVISTGVFGEWFGECLQVYGADVTFLRAPFGDRPSAAAIDAALRARPYKLVTVTHVDTSTGVLADVREVAGVVRSASPSTLLAVDGVCSVAAEPLRMEEWGVDVVLTASQKALGVPPGLAVLVASQRAVDVALNRKAPPAAYYASLKKLPIMKKYEARQPSYFATPAVQLVMALHRSLSQILAAPGGGDLTTRFAAHVAASDRAKGALEALGLRLVPVRREVAAHSLTAVRYPQGVRGPDLLAAVARRGVVLAGGLHPDHAAEYFRIGHMHISAVDAGHVDRAVAAVKEALE